MSVLPALQVSVKANGHHWEGSGLREGSLLINLQKLKGVRIDVDKVGIRCYWVMICGSDICQSVPQKASSLKEMKLESLEGACVST